MIEWLAGIMMYNAVVRLAYYNLIGLLMGGKDKKAKEEVEEHPEDCEEDCCD